MLDCLILGDSIAVGLHQQQPKCAAYAKGGINTHQFNKQFTGEFYSNLVIISLGSNDHKFVKTHKELETLRSRVIAKSKVVWILPVGNAKGSSVDIKDIRKIVVDIATKYGDNIIDPQPHQVSSDKIHPNNRGYKEISNNILGR